MRPLRLEMTAFGPFAGTQLVDFTLLGERSFFLIHGPTGAGKTTLLDAMCFVLYGDTSGGERSGEGMRSHFSDATTMTEVSFEFTLGDKVYRVVRRPEQLRPAKRGDKLTTEKQMADLYDITAADADHPEGSPIASGWSKVTEAIQERLGFRSDQFRQVVMLPQGQFRRLLMADSRQREAILETLFQTGLYSRIEGYFKQEAEKFKVKVQTEQNRYDSVLSYVGSGTLAELQAIIAADQEQIMELKQDADSKMQALTLAREALNKANQTAEKLTALDAARTRINELNAREGPVAERRLELVRGRQAAGLIPVEAHYEKRKMEHREVEDRLERAAAALDEAQDRQESAAAHLAEELKRDAQRHQADEELIQLRSLAPILEELQGYNRELSASREKSGRAEKAAMDNALALASLRDNLAAKRTRWKEVDDLARQCQRLQVETDVRQRIYEMRNQLETARASHCGLAKQLASTSVELDSLQKQVDLEKQALAQMQLAWHRGQAAILASQLKEGAPCPVCGSTQHPAPAMHQEDLPDEAAIKQRQLVLEQRQKELDTLQKRLSDQQGDVRVSQTSIAQLEAELGDEVNQDPGVLFGQLQGSQQDLKEARQAEKTVDSLEAEIEALEKQEAVCVRILEISQGHLVEAQHEMAAAAATLEQCGRRLPAHIRDGKTLETEREKMQQHRDGLYKALKTARDNMENANLAYSQAKITLGSLQDQVNKAWQVFKDEEEGFKGQIARAAFTSLDDYQAARRSEVDLDAIEAMIRDYEQELRSARDHLARCQKEAMGMHQVDLEAIKESFEQVSTAEQAARDAFAVSRDRLKNKREALANLEKLDHRIKELEKDYGVLGGLADAANGRNAHKITFQRFVLGALLDDVVMAASQRLKMMSQGRFELQRTLERSHAGAAGGLNIEVFDHYTGTTRPVENLSGGESFLASLSLALGLAEVVQAYSGGTRLDAIFIDEGFGALDTESLDHALQILIDLQKHGRLVGIISHIDELKERIDARLEIHKTDRGSMARFCIS